MCDEKVVVKAAVRKVGSISDTGHPVGFEFAVNGLNPPAMRVTADDELLYFGWTFGELAELTKRRADEENPKSEIQVSAGAGGTGKS